jgi:hypothetical protein
MLDRCFDSGLINDIVNHPTVRPHIGDNGDAYLDVSLLVAMPENIFLIGDHGGFALIETEPDVHEIHTFILPEGRGVWARKAAQELIDFATQNGDTRIWTKVSTDQKHVALFTRRAGLQPTGEIAMVFDKPYEIFSLDLRQCH